MAKTTKILLTLILFLAAGLRFYQLGQIPSGFIPEEVSNGWNAYSLLKTGRDEWGVTLPLIFKETGGYKLALNSYLIVPSVAIFGLNEFAVRLPAALAGVIAVWLTFILTARLFKKDAVSLSAAFLLAISPWAISVGRYGVDVNWGIPLFLAGMIFFLKSLQKPKWLPVSGIFFALTYYTYFNYIVFTVLFLGVLLWHYRQALWAKTHRKYLGLFLLFQIIFLLPYLTNTTLFTRYQQATSISQIGFTNRINEHREACATVYPSGICRIVYNKITDRVLEIGRNYINHYSATTYFLTGSKMGLSGMPDNWGLMYPIEFVLLVIGLGVLIKNRQLPTVLFWWLLLYGVPSSLAGDGHIWRMLTIIPVPQILSGVGLVTLINFGKKLLIVPLVILTTGFLVVRFFLDYTSYLPFAQGTYSYFGFRDVYGYAATIEKNYPYIVVAPSGLGFEQLYIYYAFYLRPDPRQYQLGIDVDREVGAEGWVRVARIGKWHFVSDVRNIISSLPQTTLLIVDGNFNEKEPLPDKTISVKLLKVISHANGNPAFKVLELKRSQAIPNLSSPQVFL